LNRFLRFASTLAAVALVALSGCADDEKQCEDFCGAGAACVGGSCVAYEPCAAACPDGQACQDGACVATLASACGGSCAGADEICVTSGAAAACVTVCGEGQAWSATTSTCEATAAYCGAGQTWDPVALECTLSDVHAAYFDGKTLANGPAVTAECVKCHAAQAEAFMQTQHWTWEGSTPELYDVGADFLPTTTLKNPGTIGKANLVNNYCVSVAANERRCDQCHAGYGNATTNLSARTATMVNDPTRVDCLVCHTSKIQGNMAGSASATSAEGALYNKVAGAFGAAGYAVGPGSSVATPDQLRSFAQSIQRPTRENCGYCHFNGGGADSVKIMGTQLRSPAVGTDVHMSADAANGGQNMTCADCHAVPGHGIKGAGVHTPTNGARLECSECHGDAPHANATLDAHTATIACQTCHIPAYSRAMPQKTDWDWSTAGWKTPAFPHPATIYVCVSGTTEVAYDGANCATAGGTKVKKYDYMKGTFSWGQNVAPSYRWYDGTMTHVTTDDVGAFTIETGLTPDLDDRITLSSPRGARGSGKIFPFKVMKGRQAVYVDGSSSFIITPNLFHDGADGADGGFWGVLAAQPPGTVHSYAYTSPVTTDAFGAPAGPLSGDFVLGAGSGTATAFGGYTFGTTYAIETLLSKAFTKGATLAGQYSGPTMSRFDGVNPGWDWRYTKMYLDLEHEVAPAAQAIGAGGSCAACHGPSPVIPICELYQGAAALPWGVTCP
jgi:hypothetical protein